MIIYRKKNFFGAGHCVLSYSFFRKTNNFYSHALHFFISLFILDFLSRVPVIPIALNGYAAGWDENIDMKTHNRMLCDKFYSKTKKTILHGLFYFIRTHSVVSIARYRTVSTAFFNPRWMNFYNNSAPRANSFYHLVSADVRASPTTILRFFSIATAAPLNRWLTAVIAKKGKRATSPAPIVFPGKRVLCAALDRAKRNISIITRAHEILSPAVNTYSFFGRALRRMIVNHPVPS